MSTEFNAPCRVRCISTAPGLDIEVGRIYRAVDTSISEYIGPALHLAELPEGRFSIKRFELVETV